VWRTTDAGTHWTDVTPRGLGAWSKIGTIEASHFGTQTAYLAIDRHRLDDQRPLILITHDGGRTWRAATNGIASASGLDAVNVVREDPKRAGLLYAGTESAAYVSADDGGSWRPLAAGLPPTSVRDIDVHGDDLAIATHGRGFYIMDDVAPLRAPAGGGGERLLPPADAYRFRPVPFSGTPMPKDEPMAPNPPAGAYIDYELGAAAGGPVEITIRDRAGQLVRRISSAEAAPPQPLADTVAPEWLPPFQPPPTGPGLNRYLWDEHYAPLSGRGHGVWAPPGRYQVALTVGGRAIGTAPLVILPDPRVNATPAAYQAEFALARRIEALQGRVAAAMKAAPGAEADAPPRPADKPLAALAERLRTLMAAADGADGEPTADAVAGVEKAEVDVDALLAAAKAAVGRR
jgi:hypothetical protein